MYTQLFQYLLQYKELPVPGIGTFLLERRSAVVDFPSRIIHPPSWKFVLLPGSHVPGKHFFSWISAAKGISDREAIFHFNDFTFEMKKQLGQGEEINWKSVGILKKGVAGNIEFESAETIILERPVRAEKVIRHKAEHSIRVGEEHRTSVEMTEILTEKKTVNDYWWVYAGVIALLSVLFLGWYFSVNGLGTDSISNVQKLVP